MNIYTDDQLKQAIAKASGGKIRRIVIPPRTIFSGRVEYRLCGGEEVLETEWLQIVADLENEMPATKKDHYIIALKSLCHEQGNFAALATWQQRTTALIKFGVLPKAEASAAGRQSVLDHVEEPETPSTKTSDFCDPLQQRAESLEIENHRLKARVKELESKLRLSEKGIQDAIDNVSGNGHNYPSLIRVEEILRDTRQAIDAALKKV